MSEEDALPETGRYSGQIKHMPTILGRLHIALPLF
jgi:hypothetical protein